MKKILGVLLALSLALCLSACGDFVSIMPGTELAPSAAGAAEGQDQDDVFAEKPLLTLLGREAFGESYYADTPAALSYQPTAEDGSVGCRSHVFDRASIIAACDALRGMTVTARAEDAPASRTEYTLTMPDGSEYVFEFGLLADGTTRVVTAGAGSWYAVSGGEALWDIAFPAYSDAFDVFDLYFSDSIRAFADNFYSDTPVSVGYRMNSGATISSTDPQAVEAAFRALAGASVIVVENQPDQNVDLTQVRDYIFTMEDGTYYTFSFAQRCLAVTANPSFGPVYYWLNGTDELWSVEIASENTNGRFEGGAIAGLREDIRKTADVVNGENDQLSVLGVFVEYTIGEESSYIALEGDAAAEFLREVCSVETEGETVESPEGDKITVSVTLSDNTGPILYFTGDAIQQVVGINYVCDSGDMEALRGAILELGSDGSNTAEVEEGGTD